MFTIICLANEEGISLSNAHELKLSKLYGRDNNRFNKAKKQIFDKNLKIW